MQHTYTRPEWVCLEDGEPWPCPAKRAEFLARLGGDIGEAMRIRGVLGAHALDAQLDLGLDDDEAYQRFVAWSYAREAIVIPVPGGAGGYDAVSGPG